MSNEVKPTGRVSYDPFDREEAAYLLEKRLPPDDESEGQGWQLGWKNERLRNGNLGWRGWIPLAWGDKYTGESGEKLKDYVPNPPMRMIGPDKIDNLVRREDLILCRIRADWFDARQNNASEKSRDMVKALTIEEGETILPGVETIGGGRKTDKNPNFGRGDALDKALTSKVRQHNQ